MMTVQQPGDLDPETAVERFIATREVDSTERTIRSYRSRLGRFVEWCQDEDIDRVGALTPFAVDQFAAAIRGRDFAPTTIKGILTTTRVFLDYLETIEAVSEGLADAVPVPTLDRDQEASDERLAPADAIRNITAFRNDPALYGRPWHAFLELAWHTGARVGALRGLDLDDLDPERGVVQFQHRPSTGTPLKNGLDGERLVGVDEPVTDALEVYLERERTDKRDKHGRRPLFAGRQGRQSFTTLRAWSYLATHPCIAVDCPHGRERETCSYVHRNHASKCPSARSPHRIRTGSITWQLNQGIPIEVVAERVNASPRVLRRFYDVAGPVESFEERRQDVAGRLAIGEESADDDGDSEAETDE